VILLIGGVLIGFLLAVLGAGGSILLMPLLVSGVGLSARDAVPLSLLVVTMLAIANVGPYLRRGQVAPRAGLILGLPALVGAWIGGSLVRHGLVSESVQLGVFAIAALLAATLLIHRSLRPETAPAPQPVSNSPLMLGAEGLVLGMLTGISGVGGGFAIVPALVLLAGLPMPRASGTSLVLLSLNSVVALIAIGRWPSQTVDVLLPVAVGGAVGAILGQWLAPRLPERLLQRGFAALVVASALLTGGEAWQRRGATPAQAQAHQAKVQPRDGGVAGSIREASLRNAPGSSGSPSRSAAWRGTGH
jgi:uncharacterized membrane protein YfcA